mgnify:CR=1 FL=1
MRGAQDWVLVMVTWQAFSAPCQQVLKGHKYRLHERVELIERVCISLPPPPPRPPRLRPAACHCRQICLQSHGL